MLPPEPALPGQPSSSDLYDEQLGLTFTQGFYSMLYNVTAVPQVDAGSGTGPAYLLNGLTSSGYWYQVGVSWDWSPGEGFGMNYEVFGPSGASIYPSSAGSGVEQFSGPVNPGDPVSLNLYFSSGEVVMLAVDNATHAYAQETYSAEGATSFVGIPSSTANYNGFFTGLMTEWYHGSPYYQGQEAATYATTLPQQSAWMWIDEFACSGSTCATRSDLFSAATDGPVSYADPTSLITFSSHGATEASSAYVFVTGGANQPTVPLTLSYSVVGGGSPSPPVLSYVEGGSTRSATLTAAGSTYLVDLGSTWNVTRVLPGSGGGQRWATDNSTGGVAASPEALDLVYYRQYFVGFSAAVEGGGSGYELPTVAFSEFGSANSTSAGEGGWADAGTNATYPALLGGSDSTQRWVATDAEIPVLAPGDVTATYLHQYALSSAATPAAGGAAGPVSGWYEAGETLALVATPNPGWEFEGWTGSGEGAYSGSAASASFTLGGPVNESALFYPGLTIAAGAGGTVAYAYGGESGSVSSSSTTVYVPAGTEVSLTARPASFLYVFSGWGGGGGSASEGVRLSGPATAEAKFGYNYPALLAIAAATALALSAALLAQSMRRRAPRAKEAGPVAAWAGGPARTRTGDFRHVRAAS